MTSTFKLYGVIALSIILMLAGLGILRWDSNRLRAQYSAGEAAERQKWTDAQTQATAEAAAKGNANTLTSEGVADKARTTASTTTAASAAATQTIVERITHAYHTTPQAPCSPDLSPVVLPAGVLEGLREARSAAFIGTPAATGGLQSAQRQ